ncbi:MAG TPA: Rieske (2Fe-2S) protein [Candidatus Polarisedimenticolia bacterium]|nr:Rieske (2Fe-2S) protein [Candidatus Polarisedimenticolia bacterium]
MWGLAAAGVGLSFLRAPSAGHRPSEGTVRCGPFSTLAIGEGRFVPHGARPLFVVRASESEVLALSAVCTHLHCVLRWDPGSRTIQCPCHAGAFDRSGAVLSGPPSRPLPQLEADVRADEIVVHVGS